MIATRQDEAGYALVAAVAAILFFAFVSLGVLTLTQRTVVTGVAEVEAARASAAADAGIALGLRDLLSTSILGGPSVGGRPRLASFEGARLTIITTSERGKVPLNLLDENQLTALLEYVGLRGEPLEIARDSYLDWLDDDDEPRPSGAEMVYYTPKGIRVRNGGFVTIGELGRVRGFTPAIVAKVGAIATTDFGSGTFDLRLASAPAIRIMYPAGDQAVAEIVRTRNAEGQVAAFESVDRAALVGTPVTVAVTAAYPSGAIGRRSCVFELTGAPRRPYVIRHCG